MDALAPNAQIGPMLHDVTIITTKKYACAKVLGVPPEEFGIEKNARNIADCNYAFHDIVTKTEGQLIAEGFDEDQIKSLASWTGAANLETIARDSVFEHETASTGANSGTRIVPITEHYIRIDYEGNGKPALYMIITGMQQGEILRKTVEKDGKDQLEDCVYPIDMIPFAAATPIPVTHRFFGRSIADVVMDIQRVKTALVRGMLDNLYLHNAPRPVVSEAHSGSNTIDDILTVRQGAPIRMKQPGGIEWQTVPDITGSIYPALQYMDTTREIRTGMSNQSQGIDANALQNQSATAVAQVFSASQMRMKLIARILAEGVKDIFSLLHATIRKHGQEAQTVRLRNNWVQVDPRQWKTRNDMTIHVGLGNGDKAQQYAQVMGIANLQKELLIGGKGHLVPDAQLFNTASELVKLTGHKNPDKFFADPNARDPQTGQLLNPPQPPAPDPKVQIEAMKAENIRQETMMKGALEQKKAEVDASHQLMKTQADITLAQEKFKLERELKLIDAQLKREEDARAAQLHAQQMDHAQVEHQHKIATGAQQHEQTMQKTAADSYRSAQDHEQKTQQTDQQHKASLEQTKAKTKPEKPDDAAVIQFVYGKDGKIAQVKKGEKTMNVQRNAQGKMTKIGG